jgi:hypothetical protein
MEKDTGLKFSGLINDRDLELLLKNVSYPLTKADLIYKAKSMGVPPYLMSMLKHLPARFYRSKNEIINQCFNSSSKSSANFGILQFEVFREA